MNEPIRKPFRWLVLPASLILFIAGTLFQGCSAGIETTAGLVATMPSVLLEHDYDPVSDAVVSWSLKPGEAAGQTFTLPPRVAAQLRGFRVKLLRVGAAPPLSYRIGTAWGEDDVCSGEIGPEKVSAFFERWCGAGFAKALPLAAGRRYYLRLEVPRSGGTGHYEVFGTASERIHASNFKPQFQYIPAWGSPGSPLPLFENPINLDYGSRTPRYEGGSAIGADGAPLPSLDFAFQIRGSPLAESRASKSHEGDSETVDSKLEAYEERFAFIEDQLLAPMHHGLVRTSESAPGPDEVELTSDWSLLYPSGSGAVARTSVEDFRKFMEVAMGVRIGVRTVSHFPLPAVYSHTILAVTRTELPEVGKTLAGSEAFRMEVSPDRIVICGFDERGLMRGLQYLEDRMSLRRAPLLTLGSEERQPRYSPRITCAPFYAKLELEVPTDPYTHNLLSRISHYGFSALWLWGELADVGRSSVYPELGVGVNERQKRLTEIVDRAQHHGLDVYLYLGNRPLPASFFEKHPAVRGTPLKAYGGDYVLCTSTFEGRQFIEEATQDLYRNVSKLRGIVFIVGGEGFFHCYTRGIDCPRCSLRPAQEVVAELAATITRAVRRVKSDAHVALWPYSASNLWSKDDVTQSRLIEKLPREITFLTEFGKEGLISFDGVTVPAYDYPISYVGPSERFVRQADLTEHQALQLWVKTEHAIALEFVQTPYIPVFFQWAERFRRIQQFRHVTGIFANWMHYGFMPSIAAEIFKWHAWSPPPDTEKLLQQIARRDFGPGTEPYALDAWREWSEAIKHYPFSGPMALGIIQKGPAHPLFLDPQYRPLHSAGRQFKNDLSWTRPWGPELALKQLSQLEAGWYRGVRVWDKVISAATPELRENARRERGIARALLSCIRSTLNVGRFYQVRERLWQETDPSKASVLLQEMTAIARAELENAQAVVDVVYADSRLGYANSGKGEQIGVPRGGIYSPRSIEKKIEQLRRLLDKEIPEYREKRGKTRVIMNELESTRESI